MEILKTKSNITTKLLNMPLNGTNRYKKYNYTSIKYLIMKSSQIISFFLFYIICIAGNSRNHTSTVIDQNKLPFEFPDLKAPVFPDKDFNIRTYGANNDDLLLTTNAIREAIDECNK